MKVIVACETTQVVTRELLALGHDAISCDILPGMLGLPHIQADCREVDYSVYDLAICHPPCTKLCVSGARWWKGREHEQEEAIALFMFMVSLPVPLVAVENPVGIMSTRYRKPDQIVQPWWFGDGYSKATCWWLKGLPKLRPTNVVASSGSAMHRIGECRRRWLIRSTTPDGMARAMASQWAG